MGGQTILLKERMSKAGGLLVLISVHLVFLHNATHKSYLETVAQDQTSFLVAGCGHVTNSNQWDINETTLHIFLGNTLQGRNMIFSSLFLLLAD